MVYWFFLLRGLECSFLDFSLDSELWVFSFFSQVSIHITLSSFSIGKSWFLGWFSWVQEEVLHFLVSWHLEILLLGLYCIFPFFFFFALFLGLSKFCFRDYLMVSLKGFGMWVYLVEVQPVKGFFIFCFYGVFFSMLKLIGQVNFFN